MNIGPSFVFSIIGALAICAMVVIIPWTVIGSLNSLFALGIPVTVRSCLDMAILMCAIALVCT